jgi:hypothetical protein
LSSPLSSFSWGLCCSYFSFVSWIVHQCCLCLLSSPLSSFSCGLCCLTQIQWKTREGELKRHRQHWWTIQETNDKYEQHRPHEKLGRGELKFASWIVHPCCLCFLSSPLPSFSWDLCCSYFSFASWIVHQCCLCLLSSPLPSFSWSLCSSYFSFVSWIVNQCCLSLEFTPP